MHRVQSTSGGGLIVDWKRIQLKCVGKNGSHVTYWQQNHCVEREHGVDTNEKRREQSVDVFRMAGGWIQAVTEVLYVLCHVVRGRLNCIQFASFILHVNALDVHLIRIGVVGASMRIESGFHVNMP